MFTKRYKMKIVNVDLDHVLYDLYGTIATIEGYASVDEMEKAVFYHEELDLYTYMKENFNHYIDLEVFLIGGPMPGFKDMLDHLVSLKEKHGFQLNLLGAHPRDHEKTDMIVHHKTEWLKKNGIYDYFDDVIFVNGSKSKVKYANDHSVLIDDYKVTEQRFKDIGAPFILHTSAESTISQIDALFE